MSALRTLSLKSRPAQASKLSSKNPTCSKTLRRQVPANPGGSTKPAISSVYRTAPEARRSGVVRSPRPSAYPPAPATVEDGTGIRPRWFPEFPQYPPAGSLTEWCSVRRETPWHRRTRRGCLHCVQPRRSASGCRGPARGLGDRYTVAAPDRRCRRWIRRRRRESHKAQADNSAQGADRSAQGASCARS